jgi:hypothetical protein
MLLAILVSRARWRLRLAAGGLVVLGFGLAITPWMVRNQSVHGVAMISAGLGDALFARTHRHDAGFEWRDYGEPPADARRAQIRRRVFELAAVHEHEVEVRGALQAELGLTEIEGDAALREAALQVIRQQPIYWVQGTLGMLGVVWWEFEKPLEVRWDMSTRPRFTRSWPEPIRPLLDANSRATDRDRAMVERLASLYQDYSFGPLVTVLFLAGAARCLGAGWSSGAVILLLIVLSQLLLYVALDGPLVRYRYAAQPLITLVAAGGATWLIACLLTVWRRRPAQPDWRPRFGLPAERAPWRESSAERPRVAGPSRTP